MGSFSIWHWLIVLAIVVLVFGTRRLRNAGGDVGAAVKNFKAAMKEGEAEGERRNSELSPPQSPSANPPMNPPSPATPARPSVTPTHDEHL